MELSSELEKVAGDCSPAKPAKGNSNRCKTNLGTFCDFTRDYQIHITSLGPIVIKMDTCKLIGLEGYSASTHYCIDTRGILAGCANNCPGGEPKPLVVGGVLAYVSAIAGTGILNALPFLMGAGVGALGLG